jgi:hypothetical protein
VVDVAVVAAGGGGPAGEGERAALPQALARALLEARAAAVAARAEAAALQRRCESLAGGSEALSSARLALAAKLEDALAEVRALKAALAKAREEGRNAAPSAPAAVHEEKEAVPADGADPFSFATEGASEWT